MKVGDSKRKYAEKIIIVTFLPKFKNQPFLSPTITRWKPAFKAINDNFGYNRIYTSSLKTHRV